MLEDELLKLLAKNSDALKENLLKSEVIEDLRKKIINFLEESLKRDSLLYLRFEKLKTNKNIRTLWSTQDGYPAQNPQNYLDPWIDILNQYIESKTIKERWRTKNTL